MTYPHAIALVLAALAAPVTLAAQPLSTTLELPAVKQLVDEGFATKDGQRFRLPPPLITPDMPADAQRQALEDLVGERRLDKYLQDSVVASYELEISDLGKTAGDATVRRLDVYFVVHGRLSMIHEKELLGGLMGGGAGQQQPDSGFETYAKPLDETQPRPDGLPPQGVPTGGVFKYRFPILEKVVVSGLARSSGVHVEGAVVQSAESPPELLDDPANPTQWRPIPRGAENDSQLGPPEPFQGFCFYLHATQLSFMDNAVLVECHGAYVEPHGWFNGRNLLASKLPLLMQQSVRDFRRKLKAVQATAEAQ